MGKKSSGQTVWCTCNDPLCECTESQFFPPGTNVPDKWTCSDCSQGNHKGIHTGNY